MRTDLNSPCDNQYSVAVIIPAYNAEKTLRRIVNQVLSQSYAPNEIILVNDGSTDSTADIIVDFQNRYPNIIKGVHQKNRGVAAARNAGIQEAQSRYLTFVDADDEINSEFLKNFVDVLREDRSDLIVSGYVKLPSGSVSLDRAVYERAQYQNVIMTRDIGVVVCKMYDASIIRKYKIKFPEGMKASEDAVFYYRYLRYSEKCSFTSAMDYTYYAPTATKSYGIGIEDEYIGLKAMSEALIELIKNLELNENGVERLRQRIVISIHRVLYAILLIPRKERNLYYSRIDWPLLLPYLHTDILTKYLILANRFNDFELIRVARAKILRQQINVYIR